MYKPAEKGCKGAICAGPPVEKSPQNDKKYPKMMWETG